MDRTASDLGPLKLSSIFSYKDSPSRHVGKDDHDRSNVESGRVLPHENQSPDQPKDRQQAQGLSGHYPTLFHNSHVGINCKRYERPVL